jgi:Na+-driven multidrug efflux pump
MVILLWLIILVFTRTVPGWMLKPEAKIADGSYTWLNWLVFGIAYLNAFLNYNRFSDKARRVRYPELHKERVEARIARLKEDLATYSST